MVDAVYIDNNRLQVVRNDDIAFDTERPSITLLPTKLSVNMDVVFPSLIQGKAYYRWQAGGGGQTKCELWSTLLWQEWGPDEVYSNELFFPVSGVQQVPGPTTRNLPQTYIGSVSSLSNDLDIRIRLNRTTTPPNMKGVEPPIPFFPLGQWINLPGGSCTCEYFAPLIRHFDIVRTGNDIYLRRFQSVKNADTDVRNYAPGGNPQANIAVNQSGWNSYAQATYGEGTFSDGSDSNQLFPRSNSELATLINLKPYSNDGNKRPGGTNPCSGAYPNLTSIYNVDIEITPGVYKP